MLFDVHKDGQERVRVDMVEKGLRVKVSITREKKKKRKGGKVTRKKERRKMLVNKQGGVLDEKWV